MLHIVKVSDGASGEARWFFDDGGQAEMARYYAYQRGILLDAYADYISDFDEFKSWVDKEHGAEDGPSPAA